MQALISLAFAQADQGLRCRLTESMDIVEYVSEQKKSRSDCTHEHAHLEPSLFTYGIRFFFSMLCIIGCGHLLEVPQWGCSNEYP